MPNEIGWGCPLHLNEKGQNLFGTIYVLYHVIFLYNSPNNMVPEKNGWTKERSTYNSVPDR